MKGSVMPQIDPPSRAPESTAPRPWWRYGMVWFMLSGPAIAVVAALASAVIAFRNADTVLTETPTPTSLAAHALAAKH
jgi:hypothetical protein